MFNIQEIQDCLFNLVGWKNSLNTCEIPLDPALSTSETGQYYNNTHALLRLDNLQAIAPSKNDYNYPTYDGATSYDTDDIVVFVGLYYQSLTDANVGNDPSTDVVNWKQIYPFSIWLEEQTKESINNLFNSVFVSKKINQQSKSLLADSTIYNAGARTNFEITQSRFVGYALALGDYKNLKLTIDKIGLRFTDNVVDLPIYIYHSSQTEAIKEITITTTRTSNFVWEKLSEPIILEYWNDLINTGGYFYVGYYEEDLPAGVKAINDTYDAFKGPCGSCPAHRKAKQSWDRYARFAQFYPLAIPNSALNAGRNIWEGEYNTKIINRTFGLNLSFSITCDVTDIICKNKYVFTNALIKQVQRDFANYMLNTNRTDELSNRLRKQSLLELSDEGGKLEMSLEKEVQAIDLDLSDLDTPCCPTQKFKGVRNGSI